MADAPRPGSNFETRETALLEALWRGDELAAVLAEAQAELAALRMRLARAGEAVAELTEIGDAAQAAIDELRARTAFAETQANLYRSQREALAAELFAKSRQDPAEPGADAAGRAAKPAGLRGAWRRKTAAWRRFLRPGAARRE